MPSCVQGYDEELERERIARNIVYLDGPVIVCGEPLRNLTPHLLVTLTVARSPFLVGGHPALAHVAQFLWACHANYAARSWWKRRRLIKLISRFDLSDAVNDIHEFLDLTFMDTPSSIGKSEKPIASDVAWLIYRFRNPPWNQAEAVTMHTPFRKLYQELRCWQKENGAQVNNRSDIKKSTWLQQLNEAVGRGEISQADVDGWNRAWREGPEAFAKWQAEYKSRARN